MKDPERWLDRAELPDAIRARLQAEVPRGIPAAARQRGHLRVRRLAALPATGILAAWVGPLAAKALAVSAVGAALATALVPAERERAPKMATVSSAAPAPARRGLGGVPSVAEPSPEVDNPAPPAAPPPRLSEAAPPEPPARPAWDGPREVVAAEPRSLVRGSATASRERVPAPADASRVTRRATPEDPLAREVGLLARARAELATDPRRALDTLRTHAREFPTGSLTQERRLLELDALLRGNEFDRARELAEQMLRAAPDGIYAQRVRERQRQLGVLPRPAIPPQRPTPPRPPASRSPHSAPDIGH